MLYLVVILYICILYPIFYSYFIACNVYTCMLHAIEARSFVQFGFKGINVGESWVSNESSELDLDPGYLITWILAI